MFESGESGQPQQCKGKAGVVRGSAGVGWCWQGRTFLLRDGDVAGGHQKWKQEGIRPSDTWKTVIFGMVWLDVQGAG